MSRSILSSVVAAFLVACGSGDRPPTLGEPTGPGVTKDGGGVSVRLRPDARCPEGWEGCPCDTPGAKIDCGMVKRVSGSYVACSPGTATCASDLTWGACLGDQVAHKVTGTAVP
jgi:hypothetical protein